MELNRIMTFEEMSKHMQLHSVKVPSRVSVGVYAKELGFSVYKPMIKGKVHFFYVNAAIPLTRLQYEQK